MIVSAKTDSVFLYVFMCFSKKKNEQSVSQRMNVSEKNVLSQEIGVDRLAEKEC